MKHTMATPCEYCPFRKNITGYLRKDRVVEIVHSVLRGASFPCHKTTQQVDDEDGICDMEATEYSAQCAGAEIFAAKHGTSSQMSRISERLGVKVSKLNMRAKVCGSLSEMIEVHCGKEEIQGEPCEIVDDGCLAPAGYNLGGIVVEGSEFVDTTCDECGRFVCDACSLVNTEKRVCNYCKDQ
jgi:hypothetical protein